MKKFLLLSVVMCSAILYTVRAQVYDTVVYPNVPDSITIDWGTIGVGDTNVVEGIKQLTTNVYDDFVQCWGVNPFSMDGKKMLYTSRIGSGSSTSGEIIMMNVDGTEKVLLTMNDYCDSHANFTPDGKFVVYQADYYFEAFGDDYARIFIAPLDSMIAHPDSMWGINLIDVEGPAFGDTTACFNKPIVNSSGTKIAFRKDTKDTISGLFTMNIDGTGLVHISDTVTEPTHHEWSPNGQSIVFNSCLDNSSNRSRVYITRADGSTSPIQISPMEFVDSSWCSNWPSYSPNGRWISYHVKANNNPPNSIMLYNVLDESTTVLVSNDSLEICGPTSWDPASEWVLYKMQSAVGANDREIYMKNINTGENIKLTAGYYDYREWFLPDGNGVLIKDRGSDSRDVSLYGQDMLLLTFEQDLISPVVNTKNFTVFVDESCSASISPEDIDNGSWDNIEITDLNLNISDFDCDDIGELITVILTAEDAAGNTASANAIVTVEQVVTGINTTDKEVFRVYPNPADSYIQIELPYQSGADLTITDVSGRIVLNSHITNGKSIDVSTLKQGLYFAWVKSENLNKVEKITITR